ncbi:MAG: DUF2254 domain-containing protein [Polyangiaceae bacterium]|nr:DUF2254 domain-containing protein [Polyangiaceae bacterium]
MAREPNTPQRQWVYPMVLLASIALTGFALLYTFDHFFTGGPGSGAPDDSIRRYFFFDQSSITDAASSLGSMVAGVLGIVISVVAIVVQLSAERYTGVTSMFFRDRINIGVMGFYVIACVCGVWVGLSIRSDYVPRITLLVMMLFTTVGLVGMAPYFAYVFRFLEPANIIARIQSDAGRIARRGSASGEGPDCVEAQGLTLSAMEELTDITSNSISGKDKIIASRAVDALKDFAVEYLSYKSNASDAWFSIGESIRANPDFVAMDPESLGDLVKRRTWVEWKVMRQYLGIYNEALGAMRDINYLVAIDTRYIGEAAAKAKDEELIVLVLRYMNSYMRATLNAKDVHTAYNVLNQYRLFVESLLRLGCFQKALEAVEHMKYYGHVSYDMKLPFVTETVAYDVGAICQVAHELDTPNQDKLLAIFLELDRPSPERGQDQALKGVRKAQVKLAAYYLSAGDEAKARRIRDDMEQEPRHRLLAIREELVRVETKDFWEIIDRGRNFEFMPPKQKESMKVFFSWFDQLTGAVSIPPAASTPKVPPSTASGEPSVHESAASGPPTAPTGKA